MEKYKSFIFICSLPLLMGLTACNKGRSYFPSNMDPQHIEIVRFDHALLNVSADSALQDIRFLYDEYEAFMPVWTENILGIAADDTLYLAEALPQFLQDTLYGFGETNAEVRRQFANIDTIQEQLDAAFTRLHYLYADLPLPLVYFFISGFNASILFVDDDLAVGTDMYLGGDWKYYNRVVYEYQKQNMRKSCIPIDVVSAYLFRNIPYTSVKNRLLENMIYRGKIMYVLSLLLPDYPEYEIMGYTEDQWNWCIDNERAIWNHIMDKRDLFNSESMVLTSYLNDGPFTSEVSQDSPGRVGTWIGWRIAQSYMENNPDVTLQQLLEDGDAQLILRNSFYKP
ncbi:MAG: hypothetical protein MJZ65_04725 [Paludibacteraceae bacterium]|nr:hypothetical protein [Paludibacteraceae bacterium]